MSKKYKKLRRPKMSKNNLKIDKINKKSKKGVTLVALVVTIVVLLILAGVTIGMLRGDTGLINQAQNAKMETEIAEGKEKLEMMYSEKLAEEKGNRVSLEEYVEYIEGQGIPTKQENGRTYAEVEGKIYEIKMENGRIEIEYIEEGHIDDPRIQEIEVIEKTLNSIKIKVEAMRMEGGTYYYYIGTDQDKLEEKGNNQEGEYMDWL